MAKFTKKSNKLRTVHAAMIVLCSLTLPAAFMSESLAQQSIDSEITVERSESVRISNVDDWTIGIFTSTDTINSLQYEWDWQCVYTSTGSFRVDVTSGNGGAQLALESSGGDQMTYQIYTYSRAGNIYSLLGHNTSVFALNNLSGSQSLTCNDEPSNTNLWFAAVVRPPAFNAAPPGIYRDTVTIVVSPE